MNSLVLDDITLVRGLDQAAGGTENQRSEYSSFVKWANVGELTLRLPALCLSSVARTHPHVHDYWLELALRIDSGGLYVTDFRPSAQVIADRRAYPNLSCAAFHTVSHAIANEASVLTLAPETYLGTPVDVTELQAPTKPEDVFARAAVSTSTCCAWRPVTEA